MGTYDTLWRMFDVINDGNDTVCRACGCLVPADVRYAELHADRETRGQWRTALPSWARDA
jgi:hypothetical protein